VAIVAPHLRLRVRLEAIGPVPLARTEDDLVVAIGPHGELSVNSSSAVVPRVQRDLGYPLVLHAGLPDVESVTCGVSPCVIDELLNVVM
jgi:uncharacterized protein YbjT (DUF2867 family)